MVNTLPPPDSVEHPWKYTMIMEGPIRMWNRPVAVAERQGRVEVYRGADVSTAAFELDQERRKTGNQLISTLLLDTTGGYIEAGVPLSQAIAYLEYQDVPTTAFVDDQASSYGGILFGACKEQVTKRSSTIMLHQFFLWNGKSNGAIQDRITLCNPREEFREWILGWIKTRLHPLHHPWAIQRANEAFMDPEKFLDDVYFQGWELKRAGMIKEVVRNRRALGKAYGRYTSSDPSKWPTRVQRFFR